MSIYTPVFTHFFTWSQLNTKCYSSCFWTLVHALRNLVGTSSMNSRYLILSFVLFFQLWGHDCSSLMEKGKKYCFKHIITLLSNVFKYSNVSSEISCWKIKENSRGLLIIINVTVCTCTILFPWLMSVLHHNATVLILFCNRLQVNLSEKVYSW